MLDVLISLLFVGLVVFLIFKFFYATQTNSLLVSKSGKEYPSAIGDRLLIAGSTNRYAGVEIWLPKTLPHIYLDNTRGTKTRGPRVSFSNNDRLSLEGDFDKHFQLFCHAKYRTLVLSIITPDIMLTIVKAGGVYDIEIDGQYLRIISTKRNNLRSQDKTELENIARLLIEEIEHKLKSWSKQDQVESRQARLQARDEESLRLFGRYIGIFRFTIYACLALSLVLYFFAFVTRQENSELSSGLFVSALLVFPGTFFILIGIKHNR